MILKLTKLNGDLIEIDSENIEYLNSMEEAGKNDEGTLISTTKDKNFKVAQEKIPDMFKQAYELGYKDGYEQKVCEMSCELTKETEMKLPIGWFEVTYLTEDEEQNSIVVRRAIKADEVMSIRENYYITLKSFIVEITLRNRHLCITTESYEDVMEKYMKALEETNKGSD